MVLLLIFQSESLSSSLPLLSEPGPLSGIVTTLEHLKYYFLYNTKDRVQLINYNEKLLSNKDSFIYVSPKHVIEPFISSEFNCIKVYTSIYPKSSEKYILVKYIYMNLIK